MTGIQWTDATWNPVTGCAKVSPGCAHCYAEGVATRFWPTQYRPVLTNGGASLDTVSTSHHEDYLANGFARSRQFTDVWMHKDRLGQPLRWMRPRRIFVNSMSDLFHEAVPDQFVDCVFAVMAMTPQHIFQVLTKRADRMRDYLNDRERHFHVTMAMQDHEHGVAGLLPANGRSFQRWPNAWPLPNVWLGVSVENQHFADARVPRLLDTPAAVRFVSAEPLLGPVTLAFDWLPHGALDSMYPRLNWLIIGGESGPRARPCDVTWIRALLRQCQDAHVPCFVKQLGAAPMMRADTIDGRRAGDHPEREWPVGIMFGTRPGQMGTCWQGRYAHLHDGQGGNPSEWPKDLRVREWPTT